MDIDVRPLDPADDPAVERAYQINSEALARDAPDLPPLCRPGFVGGLRHPWPNRPGRHYLAWIGDIPAGHLFLMLPDQDNRDNAHVEMCVRPAYRRRGVGTALHRRAVADARALGRRRLIGDTVGPLPGQPGDPAGTAFGQATGATAALVDVRRKLDLSTVDEDRLAGMLDAARPRATGYSVVSWRDEAPEEFVDDIAYLDSRLIKDAPMGDLAWEPERVDAARVRAAEAAMRSRRKRGYHTGLRHDATGHLVAWSAMGLEHSTPTHAWQSITIVEPRHRGHRLGIIAKIENLRYTRAHEPALRDIDTWNADSNSYMISINERMGFRARDAWTNWQLDL